MILPQLNYHHSRPLRDSNPHLHKYRINERDMGIEPTYPVWKTGILTVVLILQFVGKEGFEPPASSLSEKYSNQLSYLPNGPDGETRTLKDFSTGS